MLSLLKNGKRNKTLPLKAADKCKSIKYDDGDDDDGISLVPYRVFQVETRFTCVICFVCVLRSITLNYMAFPHARGCTVVVALVHLFILTVDFSIFFFFSMQSKVFYKCLSRPSLVKRLQRVCVCVCVPVFNIIRCDDRSFVR